MKKTNDLFWFVLGAFTFRWLIDIGDILVQMFINTQNKKATQLQIDINEMVEKPVTVEEPLNMIGFSLPTEEYYEEDYDE